MTNERRIDELTRLDVDGVIVLPFSLSFAALRARRLPRIRVCRWGSRMYARRS